MGILAWFLDSVDFLAVAVTGRNFDEWLCHWGLQDDCGPLTHGAGHRENMHWYGWTK